MWEERRRSSKASPGLPRLPRILWSLWGFAGGSSDVGDGKSTSLFNTDFLAPTQKPPNLGPKKKVYVSDFLGENAKRDPHKLFRGDFGVRNGPPALRKVHRRPAEEHSQQNPRDSAERWEPYFWNSFRTNGSAKPKGLSKRMVSKCQVL